VCDTGRFDRHVKFDPPSCGARQARVQAWAWERTERAQRIEGTGPPAVVQDDGHDRVVHPSIEHGRALCQTGDERQLPLHRAPAAILEHVADLLVRDVIAP